MKVQLLMIGIVGWVNEKGLNQYLVAVPVQAVLDAVEWQGLLGQASK
jgi:hypothetical protein